MSASVAAEAAHDRDPASREGRRSRGPLLQRLAFGVLLGIGATAHAGFEVGAAHVASPLGETVCLAGYSSFCGRATDTEKDPLLASAIAFRNTAGDAFILVKTTDIGFFAAYKDGAWGIYDVRQKIAQRIAALGGPNLPADHVFVVSDHSHHGPDTIGIWGGVSDAYMQRHADRTVDAAVTAWQRRVPATLSVAQVQGPPTKSSYDRAPTNNPDAQFRALFAIDATGHRIATLVNYAPHATVLGSNNELATGDWTAWAPQEIETLYGGVGIGTVGALGAMDWNKSGDNVAKEAEARQRLRNMIGAATTARQPVTGDTIAVAQTFIREPVTAPLLYANYAESPLPPEQHVSIDRSITPPWNGGLMGTFAGAVRLGDVFLSAFPGEPFPELHYALRDCATAPAGAICGGVTGTKANFLFGAANDFLGYMLLTPEQFQQSSTEGANFLIGCPEEEVQSGLGMDPDGACPDHFVLMVSPTIGRHLVCTVQAAAERFGFGRATVVEECAALTALDGQAAPAEFRPMAVGGSSSSSGSSSGSTTSSSSGSSGSSSGSSSSSSSGSGSGSSSGSASGSTSSGSSSGTSTSSSSTSSSSSGGSASSSGATTSSSSSGAASSSSSSTSSSSGSSSSSSGSSSGAAAPVSSSSGNAAPVASAGEGAATGSVTAAADTSGRFGGGAFGAPLLWTLLALRRRHALVGRVETRRPLARASSIRSAAPASGGPRPTLRAALHALLSLRPGRRGHVGWASAHQLSSSSPAGGGGSRPALRLRHAVASTFGAEHEPAIDAGDATTPAAPLSRSTGRLP